MKSKLSPSPRISVNLTLYPLFAFLLLWLFAGACRTTSDMKGPASEGSQLQAIETSQHRPVFKKVGDTGEFVSGRDRTGLEQQTAIYAFELCFRGKPKEHDQDEKAGEEQTGYSERGCINPFLDANKNPVHFLGSLLRIKSDGGNLSKTQRDRLEEIKKVSSQIKSYQDSIDASEEKLQRAGDGGLDPVVLFPIYGAGAVGYVVGLALILAGPGGPWRGR